MHINERKEWREILKETQVPENILQEAKSLYLTRKLKSREIKNIATFIKYNFITDIAKQLSDLNKFILQNGCVHTEESYKLRYGSRGSDLYNEYKKSKETTLRNLIQRYGDVEGKARWRMFREKCSGNRTLDRMITKYGAKDGVVKWQKIQNQFQKGWWGTRASFRAKHGAEIGDRIFNEKISALHHGASKAGFIEKYGAVNGNIVLRERKANTTYEAFLKRYGNTIGKIKYENLTKRKQFNNTLDGFKSRYGDIEGAQKYNTWLKTSALGVSGFSRVSQDLFNSLERGTDNVYYATLNGEYTLNTGSVVYFYDFVNTTKKKVIEFNGDIWHANPSIFTSTDTPNPHLPHLTAAEIWSRDAAKKHCIETLRGYKVLVVWEKDFMLNKQQITQQCQQFLNEH